MYITSCVSREPYSGLDLFRGSFICDTDSNNLRRKNNNPPPSSSSCPLPPTLDRVPAILKVNNYLMFARTAGLVTRGYHRYRYQPLHHLRRYHHHHSRFSNLYNLHPFFFFHQQQQKRIVALSSKSFSVTTSVGMAGVRIDELKEKLAVQLEAQYVDIEDLSGMI